MDYKSERLLERSVKGALPFGSYANVSLVPEAKIDFNILEACNVPIAAVNG
jgi:hypothetical protein